MNNIYESCIEEIQLDSLAVNKAVFQKTEDVSQEVNNENRPNLVTWPNYFATKLATYSHKKQISAIHPQTLTVAKCFELGEI